MTTETHLLITAAQVEQAQVEHAAANVGRYAQEIEAASSVGEIKGILKDAMREAFNEGADAMQQAFITVVDLANTPADNKAPWEV